MCCPKEVSVTILTARQDLAMLVLRKRKDHTMGHRPNMYRIKDRDQLALWMSDNDVSCRALAVLAGCSRSTTADLWAGRKTTVNESVARGICLAFEAEVDELFEPTGRTAWQR